MPLKSMEPRLVNNSGGIYEQIKHLVLNNIGSIINLSVEMQ
jgi:hypothetical protein